jgi:hypothetical protein
VDVTATQQQHAHAQQQQQQQHDGTWQQQQQEQDPASHSGSHPGGEGAGFDQGPEYFEEGHYEVGPEGHEPWGLDEDSLPVPAHPHPSQQQQQQGRGARHNTGPAGIVDPDSTAAAAGGQQQQGRTGEAGAGEVQGTIHSMEPS